MIVNRDRFDNEEQYEIAREAIDCSYHKKYGKTGIEDMGYDSYEDFVDRIIYESDESAFHGTNKEIKNIWSDPEMFE